MKIFFNNVLSAFNILARPQESDIDEWRHVASQSLDSDWAPAHIDETREEAWAREFNDGITADDVTIKPRRPSGMG